MKKAIRTTVLCLSIAAILLAVCSCSVTWTDKELSNSKTIEITHFDAANNDEPTVYIISDSRVVNNLCNTFSLLELKKVKITEPIEISYTIRFLDEHDNEIDSISLLFGFNVIRDSSKGQLYKITDEMDLNRYLSEIIDIA